MGRFLPLPIKLKARLMNSELDMMFNTSGSFELSTAFLGAGDEMRKFLNKLASSFPSSMNGDNSLLYRQMGFDMSVYLPDEILCLFDQMTMANTIEGRVPLIDIDVVAMATKFTPGTHVRLGKTKILLREISEEYLGHDYVWRKKHGFSGPVTLWVNNNLDLFLNTARSITGVAGLEGLNIEKIKNLRSDIALNDMQAYEVFTLYCLRRWYDVQGMNK
jgi:asparagine synthase (glutamine-hydrolysing)